jgi:hypothetical protein
MPIFIGASVIYKVSVGLDPPATAQKIILLIDDPQRIACLKLSLIPFRRIHGPPRHRLGLVKDYQNS